MTATCSSGCGVIPLLTSPLGTVSAPLSKSLTAVFVLIHPESTSAARNVNTSKATRDKHRRLPVKVLSLTITNLYLSRVTNLHNHIENQQQARPRIKTVCGCRAEW